MMQYISYYNSPLGRILLAADEIGLVGLWFEGEKYYASNLEMVYKEKDSPVLLETKRWLDIYFAGKKPDYYPPLHLQGTPFQLEVWKILRTIPYGQTTTYGEIAKKIASQRQIKSMASQAVGSAVGHNPIGIIVPCHRVIGKSGNLTGYAAGIDKKIKLLTLEKIDISKMFIPDE